MIYGNLAEDLGTIDLSPVEMMAWLYCPISTPGDYAHFIPQNLRQFHPIIEAVWKHERMRCMQEYVYVTAKTLWVTPANPGNRPGWHSDGFGTNDLNFIWYDRAPTEFYIGPKYELPDDCEDAMRQMEIRALGRPAGTFAPKRLLRLDPSVIHRTPVAFEPGMRTFVKISISPDRYDLEGNSINHDLTERWPLVQRKTVRNHPATVMSDSSRT